MACSLDLVPTTTRIRYDPTGIAWWYKIKRVYFRFSREKPVYDTVNLLWIVDGLVSWMSILRGRFAQSRLSLCCMGSKRKHGQGGSRVWIGLVYHRSNILMNGPENVKRWREVQVL